MNKEISKILIAGIEYDIRDSRFKELTELEEQVSANEQARVAAETLRESAETDRADAEAARVEAEAARAEEFATFTATLAAKEDVANKVTSINADADDVHYPTAKAVKDSLAKVKNIEVTPDMLSESTKQFINASGGGTITNFPDDEDLTTVDNALKLADKTYDPITYSGMGRKYLRKNIVDGKNILTQEMLPSANTIYIIQYDYDLNGATITIPENCTLDFQGGSLGNGTVNLNNTEILGSAKILCDFAGTIKGDVSIGWFGIDNNGKEDVSQILQKIVNVFKEKTIYIPTGTYLIANQIKLPKAVFLQGDGDSSVFKLTYEGYNFLMESDGSSNYAVTIKMKNFKVLGNYPSWYDSDAEEKKTQCSFLHVPYPAYIYYSLLDDICIDRVRYGITIGKCYWSRFCNVRFYNYEIGLDVANANSTSITGCTFRGGFDRGLIFRRSDNEASAGIGVTLSGCDFSGNNYCGLQILGDFSSSSITGNYFESEPGYQFLVGGKDAESISTSVRSCNILGNAGLWDKGNDVDCIRVYGNFRYNYCNASVRFMAGSTGTGNIGINEVTTGALPKYSEMWVYGLKYRQGYKEYWDSQIKNDFYDNVCIPANSSITLDSFTTRYFKFLFYKSRTSGITLTIKTTDGTYLVGDETGGKSSMEDETPFWKDGLTDIGKLTNAIIRITNTTDKNIATDILIKYFYNLYGQ